ncbi:hypothetical protein DKX38_028684 [Salix brachista]|uniref:Exosome RNA helicase MTR4-like beta-barrel domain-containing protein n=1 Tax=Salix brachista TaxID=2182728 RepID=A0A5N5J677_9ROSI|nr:hypothetical protein DKX38_028684 [Salix brachista]
MDVVPVQLPLICARSKVRLSVGRKTKYATSSAGVRESDMKIEDPEIVEVVNKIEEMERKLHAHPLHKLRAAAQAVGEVSLETKFAAASKSLRRGIMIANSLYLFHLLFSFTFELLSIALLQLISLYTYRVGEMEMKVIPMERLTSMSLIFLRHNLIDIRTLCGCLQLLVNPFNARLDICYVSIFQGR